MIFIKKSKALLVSAIFIIIYLFFLFSRLKFNILNIEQFLEVVFSAFLLILFIPHIFLLLIGLMVNLAGFIINLKWCAVASGVLYSIGILTMPLYFIYLIPSVVLCFFAFSKMKQNENIEKDNNIFIQK